MKRVGAALLAAFLASTGASVALGAQGQNHGGTVGNFYFELDAVRDRTRIVVQQGDRITFTVREFSPPAHTVTVDDWFDSGDMFLLDTFTTPPLDRPGNYLMYCRPHFETRAHAVELVVQAAAASPTAAPTAPADQQQRAARAPAPAQDVQPAEEPEVAEAQPETAEGEEAIAGSTEAVVDTPAVFDEPPAAFTQIEIPVPAPGTRSLVLLALGAAGVVAAAAFALRKDAERRRLAEVAAVAGTIIVLPPPKPRRKPAARKTAARKTAARKTSARKEETRPKRRTKEK